MKPHELAFATALVLGIFTGCSVGTAPKARGASCCSTNLKDAVAFTDTSLYQVDSTWTTDTGQKVKLGSLQGPVQVVVMFFSSCQYACPLLVHDLKMIEAKLPETVRAHTGFVLISFDTAHDTPEVLRAYRTRQQLSDSGWTLLRGNPDDTLEMAALLGVKFKKSADGQFAHSNVITIL